MSPEHSPVCPWDIDRPVMVQRWETLTFLHWRFAPQAVQTLLPSTLRVETFDGSAWVGLVPFSMEVGLAGLAPLPWASRFCETNVRTYVRDGAGRSGIWFFSLDAARLAAVVVARTTYRLAYFWSRMRMSLSGDRVRYWCRRRWPGPAGARSHVDVRIGQPYATDSLTDLDHFLTARWILFSSVGDRHRFARACHVPWPLHRAEVQGVDDELVASCGLPPPAGKPIVHYSPGVQVKIGRPERASKKEHAG